MHHSTRTIIATTLGAALLAGVALTGCSTSVASVEPSLGRVHALLGKGDQNGYAAARTYFEQLDTRTRNTLTPQMLKDENPLVAYLGASRLVKDKMYDEAAPVMAELVVRGKHERELQQLMENDWRTDPDPATWPTMMSKVGRILTVNMLNYLPDSQKRAENFLITMLKLETNKPFNSVDAITALTRLSREAQPGKS